MICRFFSEDGPLNIFLLYSIVPRFELQSTENKRLQNHVASLKADVNQLKRKMLTVIDKVKILQHEFGIPEDWGEGDLDTSSMVSTGFYGSSSRPTTSDETYHK